MENMNKQFENYFTSYIEHKRKMTNELVYAAKQTMDAAFYEYYASNSKLQFLYAVKSVHYVIPNITPVLGGFQQACINVKTNPFANKGLAKWDDVNCINNWKANLGVTKVSTDCNKITLEFDVLIAEGSYAEDLFTGDFTNMSLEIGKEIKSRTVTDKLGVEVGGVGAEVGVTIEIDRTGITDVGVKGKVGLEGGGLTLAGAEGKVSLTSGKASMEVKSDMSKASVNYK
jgi:hypothetical protein